LVQDGKLYIPGGKGKFNIIGGGEGKISLTTCSIFFSYADFIVDMKPFLYFLSSLGDKLNTLNSNVVSFNSPKTKKESDCNTGIIGNAKL